MAAVRRRSAVKYRAFILFVPGGVFSDNYGRQRQGEAGGVRA
jgi:hypothetical protein